MKTPNQLDDHLHVGLLAIALCLVVAVIADAQRTAPPVSAIATQPVPPAATTAHNVAPGQPS